MQQYKDHISLGIEYGHDQIKILPEGQLSIVTADEFKNKIFALLEPGIRALMVDLAQVHHIDSVGLAALIIVSRKCQEKAVQLKIANPASTVGRLLNSTGLSKFLDVS